MEKIMSPPLLQHLRNTNSTIKIHTNCHLIKDHDIYITTDSKKF